MTSITIQLDDDVAAALRRLAEAQQRSETDIVRDALAAYTQTSRPLPKGTGKYHSGQTKEESKQQNLDVIYAILGERYDSGHTDTAARHNEHQP